jgi:hypothetical protein
MMEHTIEKGEMPSQSDIDAHLSMSNRGMLVFGIPAARLAYVVNLHFSHWVVAPCIFFALILGAATRYSYLKRMQKADHEDFERRVRQ